MRGPVFERVGLMTRYRERDGARDFLTTYIQFT